MHRSAATTYRTPPERIDGFVRLTPTIELGGVAGPTDVALKLESLQVTGSFKVRGAFSRMRAAVIGEEVILGCLRWELRDRRRLCGPNPGSPGRDLRPVDVT